MAIGFDIITGLICAIYNGNVNSTKLRQGLFRKLTEILTVIGASLLEYGLEYIGLTIDIPLTMATISYIGLMEIVSTIENICGVNPFLKDLFKPFLEKIRKE